MNPKITLNTPQKQSVKGIFSRWFGLADIELFTAGGNDLKIKGLYY